MIDSAFSTNTSLIRLMKAERLGNASSIAMETRSTFCTTIKKSRRSGSLSYPLRVLSPSKRASSKYVNQQCKKAWVGSDTFSVTFPLLSIIWWKILLLIGSINIIATLAYIVIVFLAREGVYITCNRESLSLSPVACLLKQSPRTIAFFNVITCLVTCN